MNKKRYFISLIMILLFSLSLSVMVTFADTNIHLRVEGSEETYFDERVEWNGVDDAVTFLEKSIGEENFSGTESEFGLLIEEMYGESANTFEDYITSWGLYVDTGSGLNSSNVGISTLELDNVNELVLHYKATTTSYSDLTFLPRIHVQNQVLTVMKENITYDENWNPIINLNASENTEVIINGKTYISDEEGRLDLRDLSNGEYKAQISKEGENYPLLIRSTIDFEVDKSIFAEDLVYEQWENEAEVESNKVWEISFNKEISEESIEDNIFVIDSENYYEPITLEMLDSTTVKVNPIFDYNTGEDYKLYIKSSVESTDGKSLNKSWMKAFSIE